MPIDAHKVDSPGPAPAPNCAGALCKHLVITVHGIRTFGRWQERLESLLRAEVGGTRELHTMAYKYGYFSVFAFLVPFLRWLVTLRFRRALLRVARDGPWDRIDLVGHSFGTHIIAWGLHGIKRNRRPNVHTIILSGSVLKSDFPWNDLIGKCVVRVVNECGTRDKILLLSQFGVLFTGMAGRLGFAGMTGTRLRNRFFAVGHSGYFLRNGRPDDTFMKQYWTPLITGDIEAPLVDERRESALSGPLTFLANNAEPIKLTIYVTPLLVGIWAVYGLYVQAEEQRQIAMSRMLALEANEAGNRELGMRLSLEALRVRDTPEARRSLMQSVGEIHERESFARLCCADGAISALAFAADGKRVFSGDTKGNILQWDLASGQSTSMIELREERVLHVGTTGDGRRLVAVATGQVSLLSLDAQSPEQEVIDLPFQKISGAALSDDGGRLAVGDYEGRIAVIDLATRRWFAPMVDKKLRRQVISLAFDPKGATLAASYGVPPILGVEQPIVRWSVTTGERVDPSFVGHRFEVMSLDFSHDGLQLASGSWDQDIRLWDVVTGRTIPPVFVKSAQEDGSIQYDNGPTLVAISPDGTVLASVMKDTVALWDMTSHKRLARFTGLIHGTTLAINREGTLVAVGGEDKNVILIPIGIEYWLKVACATAPLPLTPQEQRYYLGETKRRGAFAAWLWDVYWSMRSFLGETRSRQEVTPTSLC